MPSQETQLNALVQAYRETEILMVKATGDLRRFLEENKLHDPIVLPNAHLMVELSTKKRGVIVRDVIVGTEQELTDA